MTNENAERDAIAEIIMFWPSETKADVVAQVEGIMKVRKQPTPQSVTLSEEAIRKILAQHLCHLIECDALLTPISRALIAAQGGQAVAHTHVSGINVVDIPQNDGNAGADTTVSPEVWTQWRLRKLVDLAWQQATDSQQVPDICWADEIIQKALQPFTEKTDDK